MITCKLPIACFYIWIMCPSNSALVSFAIAFIVREKRVISGNSKNLFSFSFFKPRSAVLAAGFEVQKNTPPLLTDCGGVLCFYSSIASVKIFSALSIMRLTARAPHFCVIVCNASRNTSGGL